MPLFNLVKFSFKTKTLLFLAVSLWSFNSGCTENKNAPVPGQIKMYFDIQGYFEREILKLSNAVSFSKTTAVNGQIEEQLLDSLDIRSELKIFSDSDINRSAWAGKYMVDSIFSIENKLTELRYTSTEEKLRTRLISVKFVDGTVDEVSIKNETSSLIAQTRQELTYTPSGYSINSFQKIAFVAGHTYQINVNFVKK